jgi:Glycosyltransferase like family
MIVFASALRERHAYRDHAAPGVERVREPDSEVFAIASAGSVCGDYNLILDHVAEREGLEAVVLVDEDTEIADPEFCAKVRRALADPDVGLVGCVGASRVESVAWWEGTVRAGAVTHRYDEFGGGELDTYAALRTGTLPAEVDTVAGYLLVLAPWAARSLRFDEELAIGVGFELDFALRLRQAGRKVLTADLRVVRHKTLEVVENLDVWVEGHIDLAEKWDGRLPGAPPRPRDWKARARLAEAERDAARAHCYSYYSLLDARVAPLERRLEAMTDTLGWRLTVPLRALNALRRGNATRRERDEPRRARPRTG